MSIQASVRPDPSASSRQRPWRAMLALVGLFVILQSVTVTPPLCVTYLESGSGQPVANLSVVAVWHLTMTNPAGSLPSSVLKVRRLRTDGRGRVQIGAAVMFHAPVFPFGWNVRWASSLPVLYVVDEHYEAQVTANNPYDPQRPAPVSVLSLQRTSIDDLAVPLVSIAQNGQDEAAGRDRERRRRLLLNEIAGAQARCRHRWWCQQDER